MKLAILDDYQRVAAKFADWSPVSRRVEIRTFHEPFASLGAAAAALAGFEILCIMRERLPFPRALFERLPKLKLLVTTGSRNAAIDLAAAKERGVTVSGTTNGPGRQATAELAWGLMLAAMRHIVEEDANVRAGRWQTTIGTLLMGKTLGLVGLGNIGARMARYAAAFEMRVLAWSANLTEARAAEHGARAVAKDALFRESDIVSIHSVLSARTRGIVGAGELALMKPTAILVNTSRGPIVDGAALVAALTAGKIARAALDVYDAEPLPAGDALLKLGDKVVLTPHLGYVTEENYRIIYPDTVEAVLAYLDGKPIRVMTPD